jgi:hypothetical protein
VVIPRTDIFDGLGSATNGHGGAVFGGRRGGPTSSGSASGRGGGLVGGRGSSPVGDWGSSAAGGFGPALPPAKGEKK